MGSFIFWRQDNSKFLRFRREICIGIYALANPQNAKKELRGILTEGTTEIEDVSVEFDTKTDQDATGVVVRFYPTKASKGLSEHLEEVKQAIERVFNKLSSINARGVLTLAAR